MESTTDIDLFNNIGINMQESMDRCIKIMQRQFSIVDLFTKYLFIYCMYWNGVMKNVQASAYNNDSTTKYVASNYYLKKISLLLA